MSEEWVMLPDACPHGKPAWHGDGTAWHDKSRTGSFTTDLAPCIPDLLPAPTTTKRRRS